MKNPSLHTRLDPMVPGCLRLGMAAVTALALCQCSGTSLKAPADVVVSVKEQKLAVYNRNGEVSKQYPISTSKFGLGDKPGTYGTPLGLHEVVAKIGHGAPSGAVFKSRHWTGEVLKPDSPGRDPIVSRIMWLRGMEKNNKNAYARCIYIHGTAEERNIGKPVSYGCIRMKSRDVIDLFGRLPIGSRVMVTRDELPELVPVLPDLEPASADPDGQPPIFLKPPDGSGENASVAGNDAEPQPSNSKEGAFSFLSKLRLKPKSEPDAAPEPEKEKEKENRWAFVSKILPKSKPEPPPGLPTQPELRRRQPAPPPEPEYEPDPQALPVAYRPTSRPSTPQPQAPPTPKVLPGGGAVLYSAPSTGGPGLVLKSKRSANQGFQN